ncbi:hypothetical protein SAMD00019534_051880 [Acytostelium subglobosum LB1]|uniref:hypothetical protein n=1 Tax=Acytostelium subglobosum LB1 TaxID=1410327 RepID=UPI000644D56A|nr:hypothetical protein SAMD00019534_051880 [Acytostelium subglobosum LB1]GAM22013.1 hypothetical protein SAMD00019534_051880 [Acytostelium subglobosum LB1]|eukprot:XP_012755113.1 hypothetical protein SAMD00019534_051880 [Acytostelium subglobosum LB1]
MFEGTEPKVKAIYFLCLLLLILAIISVFSIFLIGIVICIGTIIVAVTGFLGAKTKNSTLLWFFIMGLLVMMALSGVSLLWELIKAHKFTLWMIKDFALIACYIVGIIISYLLRGGSFAYHATVTKNEDFQRL